jgi:hypothetical protein
LTDFGETLVEGDGVLEAFLRRSLGIEPREPAEIDENGVADLAFRGRLEIAVALEIETQRGVGALIRGDGGEHLRGVVEKGLVGHESIADYADGAEKGDANCRSGFMPRW